MKDKDGMVRGEPVNLEVRVAGFLAADDILPTGGAFNGSRYHMTELGLVANFLQACGCSAEGPSTTCKVGQALWTAVDAACGDECRCDTDAQLAVASELTEKAISAWQTHLGA